MTTTTEVKNEPKQLELGNLPPNGYLDGVYSLVNPQIGTTRAGKPYLKCLLRDATGQVAARQWTFEESAFEALQRTGFAHVAGHLQVYNGQVQIIIEKITAVEVTEKELAALLPTTSRDIDEMFGEVKTILATLQHQAIRALADEYLSDEDLMASFRMAPAGVSIHHAWIGGLLEHTLQLLKLADVMLPLYPKLNRDLVLLGLFLHDLGKTAELTWEKGFSYTTDGNLVGHVVRGAIWLQFKSALAGKKSGHKLPSEALRVLQHIILSHHGSPEFGAAKIPATPEAIFIAYLDNLEARTQMALTASETAGPGEFTDKVWALGTRVYARPVLESDAK